MWSEISPPAHRLSERARLAIELAVAQWVLCPQVAARSYVRLKHMGVSAEEIENYRRANASDPATRSLLRFAVAVIITRGKLDPTDRRRLDPVFAGDPAAIVKAACAALALCITTSALALDPEAPDIDMKIGDY